MNPYYDPAKPHHTPTGFTNNYAGTIEKSLGELLRWRRDAIRRGLPKPPQEPTPTVAPDLEGLRANAGGRLSPAATWIGHATMLMQAGGLNVLTDPVFSRRASPVQFAGPSRAQPPGVALADLPPVDVVVISHNHYDHLDHASVTALNERSAGQTLFLVPLGLKPWMAKQGISNAVELDWWDQHSHRGVDFFFTPVQHWSARALGDRHKTLWGGWAVFAPDFHWYFSGDTAYSRDFLDTRERFAARQQGGGFDAALIAVGACEPRWFMRDQHVDPAEAVQVHKDLGARRSIGVHWGTFELTDESLDQPPRDLAQARRAQGVAEEDFFLMQIGQTRRLARRTDLPETGQSQACPTPPSPPCPAT
ncbi:MAG: MBL fold metallo-hydrolase [Burkholderiales bacterium]|nr:MBL fold metallo-hydrolase [Burkholderiales bacterium]